VSCTRSVLNISKLPQSRLCGKVVSYDALNMILTTITFAMLFLALSCYALTVKSVWQLVAECREVAPDGRFNRFWWTPAWKIHRRSFPNSSLRRQILLLFSSTFLLLLIATACMGMGIIQRSR
jgi:hypothetical protein